MKKDSILRRLWVRWPARLSIIFIIVTVLVAIFAYPIAPDKTTNANNMAIELDARPAGFKHQFLLLPRKTKPTQKGLIARIFTGWNPTNNSIPINGYKLEKDKIQFRHYIDKGLEDTLSLPLSALKIPSSIKDTAQWIAKNRITTKHYYLGTDRYGRDILSRLLVGSRVSISVGLVSVICSLIIGFFLGAVAGWYRGVTDDIVMWIVNVLWSIPTLLLVFAITLTIGKGFWEILIAIGLTSWVSAARLIRGQVIQVKEMEYITAARALGYSSWRIVTRHILPNIAGPIMVIAAANFATAILVEAGLSFLGFGIQPPVPSWGLMIKEHYTFLVAGKPFPALIPGMTIVLLVLTFNILGNALRDVLDVQ